MRLGKISMAAAVALAVSSTPVLAQVASPASKLSVASKSVRAGAAVDRKSEAAGGGVILAVVAAAAVIAGIIILADGDNEPASP